jgi:hypothetical protein
MVSVLVALWAVLKVEKLDSKKAVSWVASMVVSMAVSMVE